MGGREERREGRKQVWRERGDWRSRRRREVEMWEEGLEERLEGGREGGKEERREGGGVGGDAEGWKKGGREGEMSNVDWRLLKREKGGREEEAKKGKGGGRMGEG